MLLLPAVITHAEVPHVLDLFKQTLEQAASASETTGVMLTVDGSALRQFDSSALAVLLECQRMARARGRAFAVQSLPPRLSELARLYGVDGLLQSA
ncbi:STAS domain-containing protein [Aquabacterium fontiphilum]|jgi:phospholipid transport system transporter-binding protein|uniref:STAS domain-containing protein n=1 Tax=Aquabacterium fontiphilum TaxID=450365 RepID=UPI001378622E|nr:STAS domain-containing protein [Aquabacterium fontiphilum]NBD20384.1 STAS domain-containing protein [Aquabacterium fontiphilum]